MSNHQNVKLTSAEISSLWISYQQLSISQYIFEHFTQHVEDREIQQLIGTSLDFTTKQLSRIVGVYQDSGIPIPVGFSSRDANEAAPRLFTDTYYIHNILNFAALGMDTHSMYVNSASRMDIHSLFTDGLTAFCELHKKSLELSINKAVYLRPPIVPFPQEEFFVEDRNFFSGSLFRDRRPLLANEIGFLFANIARNIIGKATITGFSQVATDEKVRDFFLKGAELSQKQINAYLKILQESDVPVPSLSDALITDSNRISPFSDKLMLYEAIGMTAAGLSFIAKSAINTLRTDIQAKYTKFIAEITSFSKQGAELLVEKDWFEQPPQTINRTALAKEVKKGK